MGIDFSNLIKNLGASAAGRNGNDKIDTKQELREYVSGWDKIKADAKADSEKSGIVDLQKQAQTQAEIDALAKAELNEIMGLDFAKKDLNIQKKVDIQKGAAFSDEEISLENLMSLLGDDVDTAKVAEHNKKDTSLGMFTKAGFEENFIAELETMNNANEVAKSTTNIIKAGFAEEIANNAVNNAEEFGPELYTGHLLVAHADFEKQIKDAKDNLNKMTQLFNVRMNNLSKQHAEAKTDEERTEIGINMINEEIAYDEQKTKLNTIISYYMESQQGISE